MPPVPFCSCENICRSKQSRSPAYLSGDIQGCFVSIERIIEGVLAVLSYWSARVLGREALQIKDFRLAEV